MCSLLERIIAPVPSANVNTSQPRVVNAEIEAIHSPVRCHFEGLMGDTTEAENVSRVLSAFSLSVAGEAFVWSALTGLL